MRPVAVAERICGGCGDHGNVDVDFAVLNGLPTSTVGTQNAQPTHFALGAEVPQGSIHAAFDTIDHAGFHQRDGALL